MSEAFSKVKTVAKEFFRFCCFGSASGGYRFSQAYSLSPRTQMSLIEPYFDDVMQPICDNFDVEMFVFFYCVSFYFNSRDVCQNPNLVEFAIDTFTGLENAITTKTRNWSN